MDTKSVNTVGFWGAAITLASSLAFFFGSLATMAHSFPVTWEYVLKYGTSLVIPFGFVMQMNAVHQATPEDKRIWTQLGLSLSNIYATLVMIVYVTLLFVVVPHLNAGQASEVSVFGFGEGSFLQLVDGLGYALQCLALFSIFPAFRNNGPEKWVKALCIANGIAVVPVFLSYIYFNIALGIWWIIVVPGASIALMKYFKAKA